MRQPVGKLIWILAALLSTSGALAANELPSRLGSVHLGGGLPSGFSNLHSTNPYARTNDALQYVEIRTDVAADLLAELIPGIKSTSINASVRLYENNVEYISIEIGDRGFKEINLMLLKRFGRGLQVQTAVKNVLEGCEPYSFQHWASNGLGLFLIGGANEKGITVFLRDEKLHRLVEEDERVHIEHEQCIDF